MAESSIRTALKNIVSGVSGISNVYDWERDIHDDVGVKNLAVANNSVNMWIIKRTLSEEKRKVMGLNAVGASSLLHSYQILGYRGHDDASGSEKAFNTLIDLLRAAFRTNLTLTGTAYRHYYPQVSQIAFDTLNGRLCHKVTITLQVEELV
jgi:hypothetical protein